MKIVQVFKTDDGKTFEVRDEARTHEVTTEALQRLGNLLKESIKTNRIDSVLRQVVLEQSAVSAILQTYRKKLPKSEVAAVAATVVVNTNEHQASEKIAA